MSKAREQKPDKILKTLLITLNHVLPQYRNASLRLLVFEDRLYFESAAATKKGVTVGKLLRLMRLVEEYGRRHVPASKIDEILHGEVE